MRTLSTLIFLSLLAACGKHKVSGPDPVWTEDSTERIHNIERGPQEEHGIKKISIYSEESGTELKELSVKDFAEQEFYRQLKSQYKNDVYGIEIFNVKNMWLYQMPPKGGKFLITIELPVRHDLKSLLFKFGTLSNEENKRFEVDVNGRSRIEYELDIEAFAKNSNNEVLKLQLENYTYSNKDLYYQNQLAQKLKNHYRLHLEDENKRRTYFIKSGISLAQALTALNLPFNEDGQGRIASLLRLHSANDKVNINNYQDHIGFWKIANVPSQNLSYKAMAGQDILIKWVSMGKLRKHIATKIRKIVTSEGLIIRATENPKANRWEIEQIKIQRLVPTIEKRTLTGKRPADRDHNHPRHAKGAYNDIRCNFISYEVVYQEQTPKVLKPSKQSLENGKHYELNGSELRLTDQDAWIKVKVDKKVETLISGRRDGNCGSRSRLSFGLKPGNYAHKHRLIATIIEYIPL